MSCSVFSRCLNHPKFKHLSPATFATNASIQTCRPSLPAPSSNIPAIPSHHLRDSLLQMLLTGKDMKFHGYDSLLTQCIEHKAIRAGQRVHAHMIKARYLPPVYLSNRLIVLYLKCDCLLDARQVLDGIPHRNVVCFTAMMSGYAQRGFSSEASRILVQMMGEGIMPNEFTFATVLTACHGLNGVRYGRQVHSLLIKSGYEVHVFVGSSLLDMYAKAGDIKDAMVVFNDMPNRDIVSCTAIIAGCAQSGHDEEALEMFQRLIKDGMRPNYVTYTSVLTALSGLASLDYGRQIHNKIVRSKLSFYAVLHTSLVDMYSKCGSLSNARKVFDHMPAKTVSTWNSMLVGYGKHGLGSQVIDLFRLMEKQEDVKPDSVTYMAVLSGCSHGGLVEEGLNIFNTMIHHKELGPDTLHYGCVVDLLGRAGLVDKAFKFIRNMPFEPTTAIWGALLGACRAHTNVKIGEYVAQRLFKMEPQNAGNYVILSNIYAAACRWEDVINMRRMMKGKNMLKQPGRSWMKINKVVHTFYAGGRLHPRREEILAKLEELTGRIREVGYIPDLSCVLHDVDDEQKEKILLTHSEKLAIAFGLIATSEGAIMRIVKNLRICVDCHNFIKYVSTICGREFCLRDTNRFHHIANGACSCGDYW